MVNFIFPRTDISQLKDAYDVLIIGSGGAGMSAAIQAHELGMNVAIFEKMNVLGGNTNRASSGMNAAETFIQYRSGIIDSQESFYEDTFKGGGKENNTELLDYFVRHAESAINWLYQHDVNLTDITLTGGMSEKRAHRPASKDAVGAYLVAGLQKQLAYKKIPLFSQVKATHLIQKEGRISGLTIQNEQIGEKTIAAKAVIIASGGFAVNKQMLAKYAPQLADYKTTNHDGATGDGMKLAVEAGAELVDMSKIQIHPTVQQDTEHVYLIGEGVRGEGAILVNRAGQRFVNETTTRDKVTAAINELNERGATLILDSGIRAAFKAVEFYDSVGLVKRGETLEELASAANINPQGLQATLEKWNEAQQKKEDKEFNRTTGIERGIMKAPYFAIHIAPAVHYTMGGIKINHKTEVLTVENTAIAGLYAAGEVTGGLHGNNRIGGNSVAEIVIFGRQAAEQAAKYIKKF